MKPKGILIAIGGNEKKKFKKIHEKFQEDFGEGLILHNILSEAGGGEARIEIITSASDIPKLVGNKYHETFELLGAKNVGILDIQDQQYAESTDVLKRLNSADVIMFSGGDQTKISRIFRDTQAQELLCDRYLNEAVIIAGTSAGAVVMSEEMIGGGINKHILKKNDLKLGKGLGLMKNVIFDSHFIRRGRFGRLAEAVAKYPDKLGIGLGEDTGVIIREGNICDIIGSGMVIFFDGSQFSHNRYHELPARSAVSLANLIVHILVIHDRYYIREKKVEIYTKQRVKE